jgi:hypothetical protein
MLADVYGFWRPGIGAVLRRVATALESGGPLHQVDAEPQNRKKALAAEIYFDPPGITDALAIAVASANAAGSQVIMHRRSSVENYIIAMSFTCKSLSIKMN